MFEQTLPSYFHLMKFDRLELKVYNTVGNFYRVCVHYRNLPYQAEGNEWLEVFGQNFDRLYDAVILAEALAPTQEGKLEVWRKYSAMPNHLRKLANGQQVVVGDLIEGAE
jgi:hypothetical protein